jgi:hypothetical protein
MPRDSGVLVHAYTVDVIGSIPVGPTAFSPVISRELPPPSPGSMGFLGFWQSGGILRNLEHAGASCSFSQPMESPWRGGPLAKSHPGCTFWP